MQQNHTLMIPNSHLESLLYQSLSKYVSRLTHYHAWFITFTIPKALLTEGFHWIRDLYFAKPIPAPVFNFPVGLGFVFTSLLQEIITIMPLSDTYYTQCCTVMLVLIPEYYHIGLQLSAFEH